MPKGTTPLPFGEIEPNYLEVFKQIEAGEKPKFNWYAFLAGILLVPVWHFTKGMWQQALAYSDWLAVFGLTYQHAFGGRVLYVVVAVGEAWAVSLGYVANWDYYLFKVQGETWFTRHWLRPTGPYPEDLQ